MTNLINSNVHYIVNYCGNLKEDELVLIIYDNSTEHLLNSFIEEIEKLTSRYKIRKIPEQKMHGIEPSTSVGIEMQNSDLILALTKMSLAHTKARQIASSNGARYLSLAEYSTDILKSDAIKGVNKDNTAAMKKLCNLFDNGKKAFITTKKGTKLFLDLSERKSNFCPGFVEKSGDLGSPPDMEVNISPLETKTNGTIVIDGSVTHPLLGLIKEDIHLELNNGIISKISQNREGKILNDIFNSTEKENSKVLAELGVGFNKKAKLTGMMLTDEGVAGCIHFGFGSNHTVGGTNVISFHIDVIIQKPSMIVDSYNVIENGRFLI